MTLIYLACAWLLGIYVGSLLDLPLWIVGAAIAICTATSYALRAHPRVQLASLCLLILFLGYWRYDVARHILVPGPLAEHNDGDKVSLR